MQLVRFLMKLTSEYVTIELKTGSVCSGTVMSVSPNMNTVLKDVKMSTPGEEVMTMDTINIRGNAIRYVQLPDSLPLDNLISLEDRKPSSKRPVHPETSRKRGSQSERGRGGIRGRGRGGRGGFKPRGNFKRMRPN